MPASYKPKNMPSLTPYLTVRNAEFSVKFYENAFGFKVINVAKDDHNKAMHVEMSKDGAIIMFCPEGAFGNNNKAPVNLGVAMPINLYVYCENVDELYKVAVKNGAASRTPPNNGFWGDRFCTLVDPDGYEWSFATYLGDSAITKH